MRIDFSAATNPLIAMEWTDANGQVHSNDNDTIPRGANSTAGGAFPEGNVRWKNVGNDGDDLFDLLVTVETDGGFGNVIEFDYVNPTDGNQAVLVKSSGYACLGVSVGTSSCVSGVEGSVTDNEHPAVSSMCSSGEATMQATEFTFTVRPAPVLAHRHTQGHEIPAASACHSHHAVRVHHAWSSACEVVASLRGRPRPSHAIVPCPPDTEVLTSLPRS